MPSWLDHLPSHEREKIRKRLRSPEAYERLREKVKGPEDLEREMKTNEALAEFKFALETEPTFAESLQKTVQEDIQEQGVDAVLELPPHLSKAAQESIAKGNFTLSVVSAATGEDRLTVVAEGNVQEHIAVKTKMTERYSGQLIRLRDKNISNS
ncbi:MAG: hypothetical protein Q7R81_06365 [Candidatus Peregrinibacteria bacterium]|nr:hypothetical protein [Candidatus Peregrinibacteria bacterium]